MAAFLQQDPGTPSKKAGSVRKQMSSPSERGHGFTPEHGGPSKVNRAVPDLSLPDPSIKLQGLLNDGELSAMEASDILQDSDGDLNMAAGKLKAMEEVRALTGTSRNEVNTSIIHCILCGHTCLVPQCRLLMFALSHGATSASCTTTFTTPPNFRHDSNQPNEGSHMAWMRQPHQSHPSPAHIA